MSSCARRRTGCGQTAFGEELYRFGDAFTRFGYQGTAWMRLDSGLYVSPTRLYVPGVGRFEEEDPVLKINSLQRLRQYTCSAVASDVIRAANSYEASLHGNRSQYAYWGRHDGTDPLGLVSRRELRDKATLQVYTVFSGWWDVVTFDFMATCECTCIEVPFLDGRRDAWVPDWRARIPTVSSARIPTTRDGVTKHWGGLDDAHHMVDGFYHRGEHIGRAPNTVWLHIDYYAGAKEGGLGMLIGGFAGRVIGIGAGFGLFKNPAAGFWIGGTVGAAVGGAIGYGVDNRFMAELGEQWILTCDDSGNLIVALKRLPVVRDGWFDNDATWKLMKQPGWVNVGG